MAGQSRTTLLLAALLVSLAPFAWREYVITVTHPAEEETPMEDLEQQHEIVMPQLPEGSFVDYTVPQQCTKAEHECKHVAACYKKKWQDIPSCKGAVKKCSELPIAQQELMPFCKSCIVSWRKMDSCGVELNNCAKWRNWCFKARVKERGSLCEPDGISQSIPRDKVNTTAVSNTCAAALEVEGLTHHQAVIAWKRSGLPPPPPPGRNPRKAKPPVMPPRPPPAVRPKYVDLEYRKSVRR